MNRSFAAIVRQHFIFGKGEGYHERHSFTDRAVSRRNRRSQ
jgi:hypothetical protein